MQLGPEQALLTVMLKFQPSLELNQLETIIARLKNRIRQEDPTMKQIFIEPSALDDSTAWAAARTRRTASWSRRSTTARKTRCPVALRSHLNLSMPTYRSASAQIPIRDLQQVNRGSALFFLPQSSVRHPTRRLVPPSKLRCRDVARRSVHCCRRCSAPAAFRWRGDPCALRRLQPAPCTQPAPFSSHLVNLRNPWHSR